MRNKRGWPDGQLPLTDCLADEVWQEIGDTEFGDKMQKNFKEIGEKAVERV